MTGTRGTSEMLELDLKAPDLVKEAREEPSTLPWPGNAGSERDQRSTGASWEEKVEHLEDPEHLKNPESLKHLEYLEHLEDPEHLKHLEDPEQLKYLEHLKDPEQLEHLKHLENQENQENPEHLEIEVDERNGMPEKAAAVFGPRSLSMPNPPRHSSEFWEEEDRPFINHQGAPPDGYCHDYSGHYTSQSCGCAGRHRAVLKMGVSLLMSALVFPVLVWGGYAFLPFDAPVLDGAPLRLVYTLRCSVFAAVPIVLGVLVLGVARAYHAALQPLCEREVEQVGVHRAYVDDSVSLFLLYFLQLGVMALYLDQSLLKLVPLLTIVFVFGRLVYWVAAACGSTVRGFGFGFCFLPMLVMLVANMYFIFVSDSAGSIFAQENQAPPGPPQDQRRRFWG